jgi:hypothetical protein
LLLPVPFGPMRTVSGPRATSQDAMLLSLFTLTRDTHGIGLRATSPTDINCPVTVVSISDLTAPLVRSTRYPPLSRWRGCSSTTWHTCKLQGQHIQTDTAVPTCVNRQDRETGCQRLSCSVGRGPAESRPQRDQCIQMIIAGQPAEPTAPAGAPATISATWSAIPGRTAAAVTRHSAGNWSAGPPSIASRMSRENSRR